MSKLRLDGRTLVAIAFGGVVGASLRWVLTHDFDTSVVGGGWFAYSSNTSVALSPAGGNPLQPVRSGQVIAGATGIPADTLIANLLGCLILGALTVLLLRTSSQRRRLIVAASTGLCGSLTTFSTFAVELAVLLRGKPVLPPEVPDLAAVRVTQESAIPSALAYLAVSLIGGALAFWAGRTIVALFVRPGSAATMRGAS